MRSHPRLQHFVFLPIATLLALLLACSSDKPSDDGLWRGKFETGTQVTLELWVPATDPALAEVEAFRRAVGGPEVLYGRATARNMTNKPDTGRFATLTDDKGYSVDSIEVIFVCGSLPLWMVDAKNPTRATYEQYEALRQDHCDGNTTSGPAILPGETVTYYVALEETSAPAFERVFMGAPNELRR